MSLTIRQRLNDYRVVKTYISMIKNSDIEIVKELRNNLNTQANGHPKQLELEVLFKERLGE